MSEKSICRYNDNGNIPNVKGVCIITSAYMGNREEVFDRVGRHNLRPNLVEHIFNFTSESRCR